MSYNFRYRRGQRNKMIVLWFRSRVKFIFTGGHISLTVAFIGLNIILGLYKCNYLTVKRELGAAVREEQGAGLDETRWRAGFGLWALCLPPVI